MNQMEIKNENIKRAIKNFWFRNREIIQPCVLGYFIGTFLVSFFFVGVGFMESSKNKSICTYDSIYSRINAPYVLACELLRPRFKDE